MIQQITIQRNRPLNRDYIWYCMADPTGDFRYNVFNSFDMRYADIFPVGCEFVNLHYPEIITIKRGGRVDIDFRVKCKAGHDLYQAMDAARRKSRLVAWYKDPPAARAVNALRKHVSSCAHCQSSIPVYYQAVQDAEE